MVLKVQKGKVVNKGMKVPKARKTMLVPLPDAKEIQLFFYSFG